jgi:hypothetical protein
MIDPFDPMNDNQTIDGYPTKTSDLTAIEFSVQENDSDSLRNEKGENLKPQNLKETEDKNFEQIVYLQGQEALEAMDILQNDGPDATVDFLKQYHYPSEHEALANLGHGRSDKTYAKDGYLLAWNSLIPYISLQFDKKFNKAEAPIEEDSQEKRHLAGQREKIGHMPLGQHSPHSDAALEETTLEIPENKKTLNSKFRTKEEIQHAIAQTLKSEKIEGQYADHDWTGIEKVKEALNKHGIQFEELDTNYEGHGEVQGSDLPTKKVYRFELNVRDKEGKNVPIYLKATCKFIGKSKTMADREYHLMLSFF